LIAISKGKMSTFTEIVNSLNDSYYNKILYDILVGCVEKFPKIKIHELLEGLSSKNSPLYEHFLNLKINSNSDIDTVKDIITLSNEDIIKRYFLNLNICKLQDILYIDNLTFREFGELRKNRKNELINEEEEEDEDYEIKDEERIYLVEANLSVPIKVVIKTKTDNGENCYDNVLTQLEKELSESPLNNSKFYIDFNSCYLDHDNDIYYEELSDAIQSKKLNSINYPPCIKGLIEDELAKREIAKKEK